MRVALLSAIKLLEGNAESLAAMAPFAGSTILRRQLLFAQSAGCERAICLVEQSLTKLPSVEDYAKRLGLEFATCRSATELAARIDQSDRLLVLADGLALSSEFAITFSGDSDVIFAISADTNACQPLERLDPNRFWAGIMILAGSLLQRSPDLPDDYDVVSILLRTGLQNNIPVSLLNETDAQALEMANPVPGQTAPFETREIAAIATLASFRTPFKAIAQRITLAYLRKNADFAEHYQDRAPWLIAAFLALGILAVYFAFTPLAFALAACAALTISISEAIGKISGLKSFDSRFSKVPIAKLLTDVLTLLTISTATPLGFDINHLFAGTMLLGLMHLHSTISPKREIFLSDRALLCLIFLRCGVLAICRLQPWAWQV